MKSENASDHATRSGNLKDGVSCQVADLAQISEGEADSGKRPLGLRLKLLLSYRTRRYLRKKDNSFRIALNRMIGRKEKPKKHEFDFPVLNLVAGEMVRVRSWEEIQKTLDYRNDYKGCGFMAGMKKYCDTTQRVMKRVERFVDERDLRLHKTSGIVILEGLTCNGDERFGVCDRSCFFFWREEWLERLEAPI